jgi:hypothetical protein
MHIIHHYCMDIGQTSIHINNRIYFFGGTIRNIDGSVSFHDKIIYLDLLAPFNTLGTVQFHGMKRQFHQKIQNIY